MIEYFHYENCPGLYFSCPRGLGKFKVDHCVRMFHEAHSKDGWARGDRWTCRNCPVGAEHANDGHIPSSRFYRSHRCTRCHRPATRLIRGRICLSCYNREREVLIGRNRKGGVPKFCPPIIDCRVAVVGKEGSRIVQFNRVASRVEAVVTALREQSSQMFGWGGA